MEIKKELLERLSIPIKLSFPVINITTFETGRAQQVIELLARSVGKSFEILKFKQLPSEPVIKELLESAKVAASKGGNGGAVKGLVIFDPYFFERIKANQETIPALRSALLYLEREGVNYVIAGKESLNEEYVYHLDLPPMDKDEVVQLIAHCEQAVDEKGVFTDEERLVIANHAVGLSHTQMKNVFTYCAYLKFKRLDYMPEIRREKSHILKDVGLDVLEPMDINQVGGLEHLKSFLLERRAGWGRDLPVKGILLAGVPGGGKSLTAKAAASVLGTSLVRLDMTKFYSKYLGETERQFSRALQTIEQIAPVTVLIDEMEKFFGASEGEHEVSKRLLGTFLYWLQERKNKIFIVATANRIQSLPPELMRAGRWDRAFFIDLPTDAERETIFKIHLVKHAADIAEFDLTRLVAATVGYTGAEIEQAVVDALYIANAIDCALNQSVVLEAVTRITPTSETRREDITRIRELKNQGFYPANSYSDPTPSADSTHRTLSI